MVRRLTDKTDIKIFILHLLTHIEKPVDFVTLNDLVVRDGIINQFDFAEGFYELCENGAIEKSGEDAQGEALFIITEKGSIAAESLESNIIQVIREKSIRSAMRLISFRRKGAKTESEIVPENGKYRLICRAKDVSGAIFLETSLLLDTQHQAELMRRNYDESPELLYRGLLGVLSGDINYLAKAWDDDDIDGE